MKGVVAAGHAGTASAAVEVLDAGGNAFDAIVAAGFAGAVCEPGFTSLGGGGFLVAHPASGDDVVFDFFVDTPGRGRSARDPHFVPVTVRFAAADEIFHCGLGSVAVPGALAGYLHVHSRLGRVPLDVVVAPAARLARDGVIVSVIQAVVLGLLAPILTMTERGRAIYAPSGAVLTAGDTLRNPELATFLERVGQRDPDASFGHGPVAATIAADMDAGDGIVTAGDLAAYGVVERPPYRAEYRGHVVLANPPPAFGGVLLALALSLHEQRGRIPQRGSLEHLDALADVMAAVETRRIAATKGTTHVSVADGDGNVAAMTTSNGEGSGYVVPGTGVMLNNMLGEDDLHPTGFHAAPAGERVASMMSPTIVLDADGRPRLALGSGGSRRIRTAILQVLMGVVDHGLDVQAAVDAPRVHWDGERLQVEPGFAPDVIAQLRRRWALNVWPDRNLYFGGVHAVELGPSGSRGAGDPRRGGVSLAARRS